tara:strand:+ start:299 stop:643 length:345 start_codon:yes stop_codon:yes gene_type:complete
MAKKKERDVLSIEIQYDETEELEELVKSEDFHQLLLDEAIATVEHALTKKRKSARVCYVPNLECSVVLEERNFSKVLSTAIKFYEQQEDYTKCAQLVKLKEEVNGSKKRNKGGN